MQYISLDSRTRQLLDFLAKKEEFLSVAEIALELQHNRNAIQYSLNKIAVFLNQQGQSAPEKKRGGVRLTQSQKQCWHQFLAETVSLDYAFTQDERVAVIVCLLLMRHSGFQVEEVGALLKVSRNTLFSDLRAVREMLEGYRVKLAYDPREGYALIGREFTLRSLLVYHYASIRGLMYQGILPRIEGGEIDEYRTRLKALQKRLKVEYIDGVIDKLALLLVYAHSGSAGETKFTPEQSAEINASTEYTCVCEEFPDLPDCEKTYLGCHLLGSRVVRPYSHNEMSSQHSFSCANSLVLYFERLTGLSMQNRNGLVVELTTHISRAMYRYKYGIALPHNTAEKTRKEYAELFGVVQIAAEQLSRDIGYPIDDKETVLLASYFFNHLQQLPFHIERVPVVLVVESAEALYAQSLATAIEAGFPMLCVEKVMEAEEYASMRPEGKLLVSTVALHTKTPYALIQKSMDKYSRDSIFQCYQRFRTGRSVDEVDDLMHRLRPYLHKDGYYKAKNEILSFLYGKTISLRDILQPEYVATALEAEGWEQAVRAAAQPLLHAGAIGSAYVDAVLGSISLYGSYSYIFSGVYLAHADAVEHVDSLSLGVATFKNPVLFPSGKPVKVLLLLCPKDKHSHFTAFKELVGVCNHPGVVEKLAKASTSQDVLDILLEK